MTKEQCENGLAEMRQFRESLNQRPRVRTARRADGTEYIETVALPDDELSHLGWQYGIWGVGDVATALARLDTHILDEEHKCAELT
jgi:hypothetical protein